jgi:group I intron endonuclease
MYGYIYITTNKTNGKRYIGQSTRFDENYFGSGKLLKKAIDKYGQENFEKQILQVAFDKEELDVLEKEYISSYNAVLEDSFYNLASGGQGGNLGALVNQKISEAVSGDKNGMYGKRHSLETKEEMSKKRSGKSFGKVLSPEEKNKISTSVKNYFSRNPFAKEIHSIKQKEVWSNFSEDYRKEINLKKKKSLKEFYASEEGNRIKEKKKNAFSGENNPMFGKKPNRGKKWMNDGNTQAMVLDVEEKIKAGWTFGRIK